MANKKQMIWDIKEFDDIIFNEKEDGEVWWAELYDNDRRLLSIIYGSYALSGANHGFRDKYRLDLPIEEDMGYEIMDNTGDDPCLQYDGCDNVYVVSKDELMDKIKLNAEYKFVYEDFEEINDDEYITGYKHRKVRRK